MTLEEWESVDKAPGTRFRTSDGKVGKLVSVHKDGATLDFTDENDYRHVTRGFYRCVQLSQVDDPMPAKPPKTHVSGISAPKCRGKVLRVKTGDVFASVHDARVSLGLGFSTILRSCTKGLPIRQGAFKGESFRFV